MLTSTLLRTMKNFMSLNMDALGQQLHAGAKKLGIELTEAQLEALLAYLQLLIKWNKAYNLTAIRQPERMVGLHLLDSLAVHPYVQEATNLIDVGTGAGLPGVVLAIMNPDKQFTLLDSNGKKTRFLVQAKIDLKLDNLTVVNSRVEAYQPDVLFDMIISRAFASLADMTGWCKHLLANDGCFLAMKGLYPEEEITAIANEYQVIEKHELEIPQVEGERHLLTIKPL